MRRLTACISGKVQKIGYRAKVVDTAKILSLTGNIQNLSDGRVKVIAEGEDNGLERFLKAIDIKNTLIYVNTISKEYSEATGDFEDYYKRVTPEETDSRLDQGMVVSWTFFYNWSGRPLDPSRESGLMHLGWNSITPGIGQLSSAI